MPSRITLILPSANPTTVDGALAVKFPPSRYTLTLLPNEVLASTTVRAGDPPARFALVAVIGRPSSATSLRATGCAETRTPTPSGPTRPGWSPSRAGNTRVNG